MFSPQSVNILPLMQQVSETVFISCPIQCISLLLLKKVFNVRSNHKEFLYLSQFGRKEECLITTSEETSPGAQGLGGGGGALRELHLQADER